MATRGAVVRDEMQMFPGNTKTLPVLRCSESYSSGRYKSACVLCYVKHDRSCFTYGIYLGLLANNRSFDILIFFHRLLLTQFRKRLAFVLLSTHSTGFQVLELAVDSVCHEKIRG